MKKYMPVIKDGLILLVVSTAFVSVCNQGFRTLKKSPDTDPMTTAIHQGKLSPLEDILGEKGYQKAKAEFSTPAEYQKSRANRVDGLGRTPLMWASFVNLNEEKETLTLDSKRVNLVQFLTKNGAEINLQDKDGWTALMWASWSGMPQVAQTLLEQGAQVNLVDSQGNTALTIASQKGHASIVKMLTAKGANRGALTQKGLSAQALAKEGLQRHPEKAQSYQTILSVLD